MSDCIKFNEANIDVCKREANALREIVAVAMGRLRQMRKQRGRGCVSLEEFYDGLDAYEVIREQVEELDQLGFEFRWSSALMWGSMSMPDPNGMRTTTLRLIAVSISLVNVPAPLIGEKTCTRTTNVITIPSASRTPMVRF